MSVTVLGRQGGWHVTCSRAMHVVRLASGHGDEFTNSSTSACRVTLMRGTWVGSRWCQYGVWVMTV